jgi:hypothetical protein
MLIDDIALAPRVAPNGFVELARSDPSSGAAA